MVIMSGFLSLQGVFLGVKKNYDNSKNSGNKVNKTQGFLEEGKVREW